MFDVGYGQSPNADMVRLLLPMCPVESISYFISYGSFAYARIELLLVSEFCLLDFAKRHFILTFTYDYRVGYLGNHRGK